MGGRTFIAYRHAPHFDLVITADYPNRTAELRLLDAHGSQFAYRQTDFKTIAVSRQQGLFDPRNYLRHYVEKGKEAASVAEIGVCIAEEVLGEEIFRHLWASKSQRTLRIQLPGATEEKNHLAAALARVPWEMARAAADQSTLGERNLLVRVVHDRAAPATHDFAMSELALQLIRENKDKHTRGERAHSLNLDNWRLTGLPEEISDLVWLDYLSFIGTQVSDLSPLTELANLQWPNISETRVSDLALLLLEENVVAGVNAAVLRQKLLQVASGAVYHTEGEYSVLDTGRYELILDLVEARKHSVVFFNWTHQKEGLRAEAEKRGINHALIDGTTPEKLRTEIVEAYQAGFYQTLFLHPKTGAHGLTLTKGTATIWTSPIYEADFLKQGKHRIYRGGQTERTETLLVEAEGTVERLVYERLGEKTERMVNFLDILKGGMFS